MLDKKPNSCTTCPLDCANKKYIPKKTKPVDILFVLDSPNIFTVLNQKFFAYQDNKASTVEFLMNSTLQEYKKDIAFRYGKDFFDVTHDYAYVVSCNINDETDTKYKVKGNSPSARAVSQCSSVLHNTIRTMDPKVIVPVGALASKAIYVMFKKFMPVIARSTLVKIKDKYYTAIPIFGNELGRSDRNYNVSKFAVHMACEHILMDKYSVKRQIDISKYKFFNNLEELKDIVYNHMLPKTTGDNKDFLSIDIETNTRFAYEKTAKMILISISWGEGESCAIWYDSPHRTIDREGLDEILSDIFSSDARKVFHNGTFDYKFISYVYGFNVRNFCWDTMLSEHILDENSKGFYNLEFLGGKYLPQFENYKKLALKKMSVKDDLNSGSNIPLGEDDSGEDSDSIGTLVLDNKKYQEAFVKYNEVLSAYTAQQSTFKIKSDIYKQEYEIWKAKYEDTTKLKLTAFPKEKREEIKLLKEETKTKKPVRPTKGDIKRPKKPDIEGFMQESEKENFEDYDPKDLELYAAMDADITRRIAVKQLEKIKKEDARMLYIVAKQQMPAIKALSSMEHIGVNTDQKYLYEIKEKLEVMYRDCTEKVIRLSKISGHKPGSDKEVIKVIHSIYGLPINEDFKTKGGAISIGADSIMAHINILLSKIDETLLKDDKKRKKFLDKYAEEDALAYLHTLLVWRDIEKTLNTTVSNFVEHTKYDGRLRTNYKQNGTATGRLSSSRPNLQNVPHYGAGFNIKKILIPDQEDHIFVNVDIKAAEIRMLMAYAKAKVLIDAIREGLDFHCKTASDVWLDKYPQYENTNIFYEVLFEAHNEENPNELQKELNKVRKGTKQINFGLIYGITKYGLSRDLGCTKEEAQEYIDKYFKAYPDIKRYLSETEKMLRKNKEVQSLTFRKRRFPRYELDPNRSYRQAINFRVQNIASDILVRIIGEMHKTVGKELEGRLVITVHDSIGISIPKSNISKLIPYLDKHIIEDVKTNYSWLPLPFEYDIEVGPSYGECDKFTGTTHE